MAEAKAGKYTWVPLSELGTTFDTLYGHTSLLGGIETRDFLDVGGTARDERFLLNTLFRTAQLLIARGHQTPVELMPGLIRYVYPLALSLVLGFDKQGGICRSGITFSSLGYLPYGEYQQSRDLLIGTTNEILGSVGLPIIPPMSQAH